MDFKFFIEVKDLNLEMASDVLESVAEGVENLLESEEFEDGGDE